MVFGRKPTPANKFSLFIADRMKEARLERGMTQQELAKLVYKSQKNISDLESGRTELNAVDLMMIAHAVEKPVRFFFPVYVPSEGDLTPEEWELIHFFREIREPKLERLLIKQANEYAKLSIDEDLKEQHKQTHEALETLKEAKTKAKRNKP